MTVKRRPARPKPFYQDEWVTLYNGDCRELMPELNFAGLQAIITDPPYGDTSLEWDKPVEGWLDLIPNSCRTLWACGSFRFWMDFGADFRRNWKLGQELIWQKHNGSSFHKDRFRRVHEIPVHWYRGAWADQVRNTVYTASATKRTVRRKRRPAHTGNIGAAHYTSKDGGPRMMTSVIPIRSELNPNDCEKIVNRLKQQTMVIV